MPICDLLGRRGTTSKWRNLDLKSMEPALATGDGLRTVASRGRQISAREVFAANLRMAREARGITQERLGELAALHPTYVSSVERGERNISIDTMERLAHALGIELADLLRAGG